MAGINPITVSGTDGQGNPMKMSIGRVHIGGPRTSGKVTVGQHVLGKEQMSKKASVVIWRNEKDILASIVLDEEHLVQGLKYLFPNGELDA